ncbi:Uu.00g042510.m01.CDS01 [Anthostomella pinea]|uniref:Uu.00g042510.m01.CDS01 n=1 Tax=Anthostomella pinea TaxID=933095 RepID=A0AAI8V5L4_9PEZI|nr:Uu.00g042510.m01.CDS01 [Anthostomella pinea]
MSRPYSNVIQTRGQLDPLVEIASALCYGATLVLKDPDDPYEHLKHANATFATPSLLSAFAPDDYPDLDTVALAGEAVPPALGNMWSSKVQRFRLTPGSQCLVPQGITGEICISGVQLTLGYWRDTYQQASQSSFLPNPFLSKLTESTMYRTGDLGFWDKDMNLPYVGRVDNQVKVRGFRVELEEVEGALLSAGTGNVHKAAVLVIERGSSDSADTNFRLMGMVTPEDVDVEALRAKLAVLLPSYARPSQILAVSALPKTANMKLDREKMKPLAIDAQRRRESQFSANYEDSTGGDVLSSTEKLVAERRRFYCPRWELASSLGHQVPVALLLRETVLGRLASAVDRHAATISSTGSEDNSAFTSYLSSIRSSAIAQHVSEVDSSATMPLSYLEEEFFNAHSISETKSAFNTVTQFVTSGPVDIDVTEGRPVRRISAATQSPFRYDEDELNLQSLQGMVDKPFDLAGDQLLGVIIWKRKDASGTPTVQVTMVTHHIITDKASLAVMLQWVSQRYRETIGHSTTSNDKDKHSRSTKSGGYDTEGTYMDWAQWLQSQKVSKPLPHNQGRIEFWKKHLLGMRPITQLQGPSRRQLIGFPGSTTSMQIPHYEASLADAHPEVVYRPSQRIAIAATALALRGVSGSSDIVLALPYMNRDEPATASMLGLFVDRLPVRLFLNDENLTSADALLESVASEISLCVGNQLPYKQIQSAVASTNDDGHDRDRNMLDVMIVYDWQSDSLERSVSLGPDVQVRAASDRVTATGSLFPVQLTFLETEDGGLRVDLDYNPQIVPRETAGALQSFLAHALRGLSRRMPPADILSSGGTRA